jgi:hypothetical protein
MRLSRENESVEVNQQIILVGKEEVEIFERFS